MSSGSRRAESAVEPTISQKRTVSWRRSAPAIGSLGEEAASRGGVGARFSNEKLATALKNLLRSPNDSPSSRRSSSVSSLNTSKPIPCFRKVSVQCSSPIAINQSETSKSYHHPQTDAEIWYILDPHCGE